MKTRYVIAAAAVAFVGVASLAHAQAPEQSASAKAAFQPPSDAAGPAGSSGSTLFKADTTMKAGKSSVERTADDPSAGKGSVAKPSAAFTAPK
jgi:hypothetical protein